MMNAQHGFNVVGGEGENSYAMNSKLQEKAILKTKPILEEATRDVLSMAVVPKTIVVADLGCSSGSNTLLFVSNVINAMAEHYNEIAQRHDLPMEIQFFLNDLPGNDFNQIFRSVEHFNKSMASDHSGKMLPPYYISGLPGSFYTRLFPRESVLLFHSSSCLHWRSQVPEGLQDMRKEYIYITESTSPTVVRLFQEQFDKDFSLFLKLRHQELMPGGKMVLTFHGRESEDVFRGDLNHLCGLLAQSLQALVATGVVEKEKLESFYLPLYEPSVGEVQAAVEKTELFDVDHVSMFESNWDPCAGAGKDDGESAGRGGASVAKLLRAVGEPLVARHFGAEIVDELVADYARRIADHLRSNKTVKFACIVLALTKRASSSSTMCAFACDAK